jgi:hypothetical protein
MKHIDLLLMLVLVLSIGCTTTRTEQSRSAFAFDHAGGHYQIIGVDVPLEGGYNFLVQREGEALLLHAKDHDQDGILDTLLVGDVTLDQANEIYADGIMQAEAEGKFRVQQTPRRYQIACAVGTCAVVTFQRNASGSANKFIYVQAASQNHFVFLDLDADGVLDEVERGEGTLDESQPLYDWLLQKGLRDGRIEHVGHVYRVKLVPTWQRPGGDVAGRDAFTAN